MSGGISRHRPSVAVVGAVVLGVGLVAMLVAGARAGDSWGFLLADPPCIRSGECTWDQLPERQAAAWPTLGPGALASLAGAALLLLAAAVGDDAPRDARPRATRVGVGAGAVTAGIGAVTALPLGMTVAISPPMGAAGACTVGALLVTAVARVARGALGWRFAAPLGLLAVLGGLGVAGAVGAVAWAPGAPGGTVLVVGAVLAVTVGVLAGAGVRLARRSVSVAGPTVGG